MTYEVKIKEVNKSINLIHHSHIDLGIFTVNATTYSMLYPSEKEDWGVDITDTELIFQVNNKSCNTKALWNYIINYTATDRLEILKEVYANKLTMRL